jgi:hypothetical protein
MWRILDYLMNQQFCDESTIRRELGKICMGLDSSRCVLIVHRREEIVRSLAIVHDDTPEKAANLEKWLYESAHRVFHDFTFILRCLARRKLWASNSYHHKSESIYRDENEAVVIELFLRNTTSASKSEKSNGKSKTDESLIEKHCLVRVFSLNKYCLPNVRASYEAYIIFIKERGNSRKNDKRGPDRNNEELKKLLEPISIMIACSAPVLVQNYVDTHVKHKGTVGDLFNIQLDAPTEGRERKPMNTNEQHLIKALSTFRLEREASQKISDLTILAYQDPRKTKTKNEIKSGKFDSIVFDSDEFTCSEHLANEILNCMSPKFAITRQRPLLFCRRTSQNGGKSGRKNEHSFEFSVKDIEEKIQPKDISSLLVIPFESFNTRFLLISMHFREEKNAGEESFFSLDDLSLGNDVLRALSANFQREKERLAFGKLKRMLREPLSVLPIENSNNAAIATTGDECNRLPYEYRMVNNEILDLLRIAQEATSASAIRLSFLDPNKNELVLALSMDDQTDNAQVRKTTAVFNESSNYASSIRTGNKIYDINRLDELNPFYNPTLVARSEICLPIYVHGFLVGILELNHPSHKGFSQWEDFLDLICIGISYHLILAREEIDSKLVANLGDTTQLAHLRNHVINFIDKLDQWRVKPETPNGFSEYTNAKDSLLKEAHETKTEDTQVNPRKLIEISFNCGTRQIFFKNLTRKESPIHDSDTLTPRASKVIDRVLDGIARNIDIHGQKVGSNAGDYFQIQQEFVILGGHRFFKLSFLNKATSYPETAPNIARFNTQIYREPYSYKGRIHLGCYIVGRIVRDFGGDIYGEISERNFLPYFKTHLFLPLTIWGHDA